MKFLQAFAAVMLMSVALVFPTQAHAALINLGTDSLGNRLIYDTEFDITWYDYTNYVGFWQDTMDWASGLSVTFGSNIYEDWRLPSALNQDGSGPCSVYNCTGSEMGHLYYIELGNMGYLDTSGNQTACYHSNCLSNTGDFQDLKPYYYWTSTEDALHPGAAWRFEMASGVQGKSGKLGSGLYPIAVRDGLAVATELLNCIGFEPPMDSYPVMVKKNRALPLKAEVFNDEGYAMTDADSVAPPVVQIWFDGEIINDDLNEVEALPAGQGDEGNQFVFTDDGKWQFNLKASNYTAEGKYTVMMASGDDSEYVFEPTCVTEFVIK
jgi:hypothetical protein